MALTPLNTTDSSDSRAAEHARSVNKKYPLVPRELLLVFMLVTSLFFLWALAHNLNDILIRQFQKALALNRGQSSLIQVAFYFGYFLAALPAGMYVRRFGYKAGIITGLILFAGGALLFFPAADARVFDHFLTALFIIAVGATFLETTANPYITLLGPPETAAQRLNLAQSFNGLGATVAPLLGGLLIFTGVEYSAAELAQLTPAALESYRIAEAQAVKTPYLMLAAVVLLVTCCVAVVRFPRSPGQRSEDAASQRVASPVKVSAGSTIANPMLLAAVVAQLCYVGAQVGLWSFYIDFIKDTAPQIAEKTAAYWLSMSLFSFMIGRFVGTFLMQFIRPATLLLLFGIAACALCGLAGQSSGITAIVAYGATSFFMSIMFPTIFALGIAGPDINKEIASSLIIMAIIGGAILPPLMGFIADAESMQAALIAPLVCFGFVTGFALLNVELVRKDN